MTEIIPNQPFDPFANVKDDCDPDVLSPLMWADLESPEPGTTFMACSVYLPGKQQSVILPIRLINKEGEESLLPERLLVRDEDTTYVLLSLSGGWKPHYVYVGRSADADPEE